MAIGEAPSAVNVTNGSQLSPRGTVNVSALPTAVEAAVGDSEELDVLLEPNFSRVFCVFMELDTDFESSQRLKKMPVLLLLV